MDDPVRVNDGRAKVFEHAGNKAFPACDPAGQPNDEHGVPFMNLIKTKRMRKTFSVS